LGELAVEGVETPTSSSAAVFDDTSVGKQPETSSECPESVCGTSDAVNETGNGVTAVEVEVKL
jgi:hypothetical protein